MAKINWNEITADDVVEAVRIFDSEHPEHPEPRSSFLVYGGRKYPAKHIRGMAYQVHFGQEISKADYSGGEETIRFFHRLGFETQYTHQNVNTHPVRTTKAAPDKKNVKTEAEAKPEKAAADTESAAPQKIQTIPTRKSGREPLKIGLYLQTNDVCNKKSFKQAMSIVKQSDIDILVLPEIAWVPFVKEIQSGDFLNRKYVDILYEEALALSEEIGRAIVFCNEDQYGTIMSIYANACAAEGETVCKDYIKHTATRYSAFEIENYPQYAEAAFQPILYKGNHIGLTICYDCNHALFSRKYGQSGVDIILNSTGGNVVYDKWFKYNKARAIENHCFTFTTMGGPDGENPQNYVFGFTPEGKEMQPSLLNGAYDGRRSISGGIYVYSTDEYDGSTEVDPSIRQAETVNKKADLFVPVSDIEGFISHAEKLTDNLRVLKHGDSSVVLCLVDGNDIMKPEKVLKLLYADELKPVKNKKYIIVNRWDNIDRGFYESKLSLILKVRSMENYCAVLLASPALTKCYQCGQNRTAQVVASQNGTFGIDLARTGGPETIWKNKAGMKAAWRSNAEWLIGSLS